MTNKTSTVTTSVQFGTTLSGAPLFSVQPGIPFREALEQIALNLDSASTLCNETVDANIQTCRSINQVLAHLIDASRGLMNATLDGLAHPATIND
ncbi:hypothetical protein [Pseudomonas folii]|uniref:DUF3077 domain-containing protein n=1 Tax=Pseudomonas folii TaxID=2762593 RepID=A0ABR7AZY5_9PSED|nr:hypothetical protein [Pseudomonas folii]MBC3950498.1 hypothetical protein [Pseudomonas folii]